MFRKTVSKNFIEVWNEAGQILWKYRSPVIPMVNDKIHFSGWSFIVKDIDHFISNNKLDYIRLICK